MFACTCIKLNLRNWFSLVVAVGNPIDTPKMTSQESCEFLVKTTKSRSYCWRKPDTNSETQPEPEDEFMFLLYFIPCLLPHSITVISTSISVSSTNALSNASYFSLLTAFPFEEYNKVKRLNA